MQEASDAPLQVWQPLKRLPQARQRSRVPACQGYMALSHAKLVSLNVEGFRERLSQLGSVWESACCAIEVFAIMQMTCLKRIQRAAGASHACSRHASTTERQWGHHARKDMPSASLQQLQLSRCMPHRRRQPGRAPAPHPGAPG